MNGSGNEAGVDRQIFNRARRLKMTFKPSYVGLLPALLAAGVLSASPAFAGAGHTGGHHSAMHGAAGKASAASRTIEVVMYDNYYEPETMVQAGETVRFVVKNSGDFVHEFNIGTPDMHAAHGSEMQMMVDHGVLEYNRINEEAAKAMQAAMGHGLHNDPNSALLEPGATGEVVWTFPADGEIEFACNVPGHYDAGMSGEIELTK
jgi:uncharacterized cupredoxin-like copper-binding protein